MAEGLITNKMGKMMKNIPNLLRNKKLTSSTALVSIAVLVISLAIIYGISLAKAPVAVAPTISPIHPVFVLMDADGKNVVDSGNPISTMKTCGECHDTAFIESHSFHSDLGLSEYAETAELDSSKGLFGNWDPITYRYLSQSVDEKLDLGTAEWIKVYGARLVGGGAAATSRAGEPIAGNQSLLDVEKSVIDPVTGEVIAWDWQKSGVLEMDCFICHLETPNISERTAEIQNGKFGSANTATLLGSGVVERDGNGFSWKKEAFSADGMLKKEFVTIQDPINNNCAACHGEVHTNVNEPITISACNSEYPLTYTTGQIISAQKISESGVNISSKAEINRSWDVHAERALSCTDCHYSINNPIHSQESTGTSPSHLEYDPRKLTIGEYLTIPEHNFARGQSAQYLVDAENKGTMRRCESCHNAQVSHEGWLPYSEQHMAVLACESCHISQLYAPAMEMVDWTFINANGTPGSLCRGISGSGDTITDLVSGYKPVLMQRDNIDGSTSLTPYNLITSWYWVYDDANGNKRPVREVDLNKVFLVDGGYAPDIFATFDTNADGALSSDETKLTSDEQVAFLASKFAAIGLVNPRIEGQIQPYNVNHNVSGGDYAISDCRTCHNKDSRIGSAIQLSTYVPGNVKPQFVTGNNVNSSGDVEVTESGSLVYTPRNTRDRIYIFGKDAVMGIDWFGAFALLFTVLGVSGHATMRYLTSLRNKKEPAATKAVYIYEVYERFWHWLQAVSILSLVVTGLIIHRPDMFGMFSFKNIVIIHNVFSGIMVVNAALSLFWHLTTGEIKQFIPRPVGFFDDAIIQAKYYISGIFKGEPHPFEKKRNQKMNPLQQATYFALLNVLLPLQILSGSLMWTVQKWPEITEIFGGLNYIAVFHSLIAWLLASFIIGHIYLTTTGATPLEAMRGMVTGWEELESHDDEHSK